MNRRTFIQGSAAASVAAARTGLAQTAGPIGANDRIRVALIGCGGMGNGDLEDFLRIKNTECAALCDPDDRQVADTIKNLAGRNIPAPKLTTRDFRRVLEVKDIDAVIVATPDHWHALPAIVACQAEKDVYVEKPLALSIGEGRAMVNAARKHNRVVQMGTQQRSAPHYTEAINFVKGGQLGKIRMVRAWAYLDWVGETPVKPDTEPPPGVDYDMWLGPAPKRPFNENRFHFSFRWFWDYSGGLMTDWGAHMIDIANWGMGIKPPVSAVSAGGKFGFPNDADETPDTQQVIWDFPEFSMVWEHAIGIGRGPEAREHGVEFHGSNGVLVVDRAGWEVYPETDGFRKRREYKMAGVPRRNYGGQDYHQTHVENFVNCMRTRQRPRSDVEIGHNSMIACHLGNIAYRLGRRVKWDVDAERFINDPEADQYVTRPYRAPWALPA